MKMIQIRNVPDELHRKLRIRAAEAGTSLSDYLKTELARLAETPTLDEMLDRIEKAELYHSLDGEIVAGIRAERDR
jgi:plasmid stability protein